MKDESAPRRIRFTRTEIERLPLPEKGKRDVYWDQKVHGLQLRVTSNGSKTFSLFRRVRGGGTSRITLGRYPQMTPEDAQTQAAQYNALMERGEDAAATLRKEREGATFDALFQQYMQKHAVQKKRTSDQDRQRYRQYLEGSLGKMRVKDISRREIASVHAEITANGHPTVANRVLALISSIFGRAIEFGLTEHNPAKGIRRNQEHSRDRFLQAGELPRFFAALTGEQNHTVRDFFLVALLTGARRANVLAMRWVEINIDEATWRIERTKNGHPQTVTLAPEAISILKARVEASRKHSEFVFPGDGETGHLVEPKKAWARILDRDELTQLRERLALAGHPISRRDTEPLARALARAKRAAAEVGISVQGCRLQDLRIHDLRRTLGSWQARTGASLAVIGKSLNHKSQATTAIYARLDLAPVRESVDRAASAILATAKNEPAAHVIPIKKRS